MKVRDRGTIKWVSLMLPEHVEWLNEAFVEYRAKPLLDEQKMAEIDQTLKYAVQYRAPIEITYYDDGEYRTVIGRLEKIDQWRGFILLQNEDGSKISLRDIIDVQLID